MSPVGRNYNYFAKGKQAGNVVRRPLGMPVIPFNPMPVEPEPQGDGRKWVRNHCNSLDEFCNVPFKRDVNKSLFHRTLKTLSGKWYDQSGCKVGHRYIGLGSTRERHDWVGADTPQEAADRVTKGWPEGARRVFEKLQDLEVPAPTSVRRRMVRADQGDELDIHSVYRGDLDHAWTSRKRKHTRTKLTVRIVAQTNLLADMSANELFWRGAAVVKLSDALTEAGYNVEIIGALASRKVDRNENIDFLCTFPLKEASMPLDTEQLAGVICNAGFHRLFGFRAYGALADWNYKTGLDGTGCASDIEGRVIKKGALDADGVKTFVTPYEVTEKALAQAWISKCLQELEA